MKIENIVFDFGGVLVDWNPRYLYTDHFLDKQEMEDFLHNICTDEWNLEQDRGRSLAEATQLLQQQFPGHHEKIQLFYDQWPVMLKSDIPGTVALLYELKERYKIYGLTNWSAETITIAYERFPFFSVFDGIVVSGEEKMIKPDKEFFKVLLDRYHIEAASAVFIDDNIKNIKAAEELGFHAIHFQDPVTLEEKLKSLNVL